MHILAGDIGGTKTLLQIVTYTNNQYHLIKETRYDSQAYTDFTPLVEDFLRQLASPIDTACFGVAGPVTGNTSAQQAQVTNLPWQLDTTSLSSTLNIPKVQLINDFQAIGYGIDGLTDADIRIIQTGKIQTHGVRAIIGAGTGLGTGYLIWNKPHYTILSSEGGHVDFAPTTANQIELLQFLLTRYQHVSYERVLSGQGLINIYEFMKLKNHRISVTELESAMQKGDAAATISNYALVHNHPIAHQALMMFVEIYGAKVGNLALSTLPFGGLYIAGGIAPKIATLLTTDHFLQPLQQKGRMQTLVNDIPIKLILNTKIGLIGAAIAASRL